VRQVRIEPRFEAWRDTARRLLATATPPAEIVWSEGSEGTSQDLLPLFDAFSLPAGKAGEPAFRVPRRFLDLARSVACHSDPGRWALLYRALWRQAHGEPELLDHEVDDDVRLLAQLEKSVRRDAHKMKAFVRFRRLPAEEAGGLEAFVAWHRPDHDIVELVAPFFVDRFGVMRWSILTPFRSVHWDLETLAFGPGLPRAAAPEGDALEELWRTYYGSIFNPARIKLKAMRAEMPKKHWATLPETGILAELLREAPGRVERMLGHAHERPAIRELLSAGLDIPAIPAIPAMAAACQGCKACPLHENATRAVFGEGPPAARLMLIGEQPGDQEDSAGRPFVGPAGKVLDEVLAQVGIAREEAYLTNAVKHFKFEPRGKLRIHRTPTLGEAIACRPWLEAEIAAVQPAMIVCLGATAARSLLGAEIRMTRQRGQVFSGTPWADWVMATYHPSALLRIPDPSAREEARRQFVEDLGKAAAELRSRQS
jgi:probable DNA metabolism protein